MKTANVTTLRTHLSRILAAVRRGDTIEVLDRKTPIARIVPIEPRTPAGKGKLSPWIERLRREGLARVGNLRPVQEILPGFPPGTRSFGTALIDAIIEERRTGR